MKHLFFLILAGAFMLTSCDGKHRGFETKQQRLKKSKLTISNIEIEKFVPENHVRIETDTILKSGLKVRVNYYSSNDIATVLKEKNQNNRVVNTHFRFFESEIKVYKNDKLLFANVIDKKDFFKPNDQKEFWDAAILQYVWLDEFESNDTRLSFNCSFQEAGSNNYKTFKIYYNQLGDRMIELVKAT